MKKYLKEMVPVIVLAVVASFMLFIYEPVIMYVNNMSDFWFDIYTLIYCSSISFIMMFSVIIIVYTLIYIISNKVLKNKKNIYSIMVIIGFVFFIITYIQGNFLAGSLPVLDGKTIEWNSYITENIVSVILLLVVSLFAFFITKKIKFEKSIKVLKYITIVIFVMLFISLVTTCMTKEGCFSRKRYTVTSTTKNLNNYSSKNNLIIFLLDSIDSETAEQIIQKNPEYEKVFEDFTYYPDTVGGYAFTRDTVPLLLSGQWNENKENFGEFYNEAMDNSKLMELLKQKKYNINIYNDEIPYNTENAKVIKNLSFDNNVDSIKFIKQEIKYDLFKYLPFYLKKYSRVEGMNFNYTRKIENDNLFLWENTNFYNNYLSEEAKIGSANEFKYIHLEGAHYPFNSDKNLNEVENGTYEDKIEASIKLIDKYLNYLKSNNIFDNSAIIILADHGFWFDIEKDDLLKRQNPILYIKGFNEKHERQISDEKVSFGDFQDIYKELLDGKKTFELFENIDTTKPRRFLLQFVGSYDHMVEFLQHGHSKDLSTLEETGNIYDR